jgi:epoxyqueuosine reductase QueG
MKLEDHPTVKRYREKGDETAASKAPDILDAEWLKQQVLEAGADDVGLVDINSPDLSGYRADILEIFPRSKTLVSFVCRLNPENIRCVSRSVSDLEFIQTQKAADGVARKVTQALAQKGVNALNYACGFPMDLDKWPGKMWPVSHKPIAVAAGLGHLGLNRMLLHPLFGNFIWLNTILVNREVTVYDKPISYNPCIDCKLCAAVCPVGAIGNDGHFQFGNCMTHNYRDRMGGFSDWVENIVGSKTVSAYRKKVTDPETVSMWQSLSYGICNKSSYCMAVCPAGDAYIGPYLTDRKRYLAQVVKPLQDKQEMVFVVPGSDAEAHVARRFPHKKIKKVGNGLRPRSAQNFLEALPLIFQRAQSEDLDTRYHFTFTGEENLKATVVIKDKSLEVMDSHVDTPDLHVTADTRTWLDFLAKEKSLPLALISRKIRIKGSPKLMMAFAKCFPS